jgi:uncharacterized phage protein (TIGR02218 family)
MKYASSGMIALLDAGGPYTMADCFTVTLQGGSVYRWTNADISLMLAGNLFTCSLDQGGQPLVKRGAIRNARGTEVATMDLTLFAGGSGQLMGTNICLAAHNGAFDAARVRVERVFSAFSGDTSNGSVVLFEGNCAGVDPSSTQVVLHVKSDLELLQYQMPRILFQPGCANCFGDSGCGINLVSITTAGTVGAGPTASVIPSGITGKAAGFFNLGVLVMTSGVAAGSRRSVSGFTSGGTVTLAVPLPQSPSVGDTFNIYPGCARTAAACAAYSNSNNYQGFPYVPEASTSL